MRIFIYSNTCTCHILCARNNVPKDLRVCPSRPRAIYIYSPENISLSRVRINHVNFILSLSLFYMIILMLLLSITHISQFFKLKSQTYTSLMMRRAPDRAPEACDVFSNEKLCAL